jgi:hypothetical protein
MSIPTFNLYDFVHQATERRFDLMYFHVWGEKSISNLTYNDISYSDCCPRVSDILFPNSVLNIGFARSFQPKLICHDQEPLNYDLYQDDSPMVKPFIDHYVAQGTSRFIPNINLRHAASNSRQKFWILLHSEINSPEVAKYESTGLFRCAYWWSHAIIARDWYRYAEYDQRLTNKNIEKLFLIYCRDVTGSRSYRKTFLEKLTEKNLNHHVNFGIHKTVPTEASISAVYDYKDFVSTGISVILETVFENQRIHFTEKTLRAIACGHPFVIANGPGSLAVLKRYGFKTFDPWINEDYDSVQDPELRLDAIVSELSRIATSSNQQQIVKCCQEIAEFNRQHFFSKEFLSTVINELKSNVGALELPNFGLDHTLLEAFSQHPDFLKLDTDIRDSILTIINNLTHNISIS